MVVDLVNVENLKENVYLCVSTPDCLYIESDDEEFRDLLIHGYKNTIKKVDDVLAEDLDIIKIALFKADGIRLIAEEQLIPRWKDKLKVVMAGKEWLDFMDITVDKGQALKSIQDTLSISR